MSNEHRGRLDTDTESGAQIRRRILIVDDDPASRETLCAQLTLDNIDILAVDSGKEALRRMPQFMPDVIVLDVMMPEMDGYAVCRRLKSSADYRHIPVILVTALDSVGDRVRGLEAGADEYITKPVTRMELQARVQTMLRIKTQYDDLERMLELRQALSYMIVHDLRNPLAAVTLYLQLLKRKGSMSAESIKYLDLAAAESQKMSNFLDDMLMLAKMERGKLTLSYSPLYLERLIASAHAKFDLLAEAQGVQFSVEMPAQPYPLMADVALFQRVVENLVANALKFAPAQTTITAVVEYPRIENNEAAQLRISVRDEGRGIPVGDSVRMFDQYEAVYMKEHGKSELGLELAFCRMVAEAHGGRIYAGNNPDRGAIITVEI